MNLTPWALWDTRTGEPAADAATVEAKAVLDRALDRAEGRSHPGILHLYIHLMEMSARPEDALAIGDLLRDLVPDAGQLRHMPTHLDVLCGDYRRVGKFLAHRGAMNFYTLYRAHNYHFKIYGAMFLGQARTALDTADQLAAAIPGELLRHAAPRLPASGQCLEGGSDRLVNGVRTGEIDLALVGTAAEPPADVGSFTVVSERLVAVIPPGHPLLGRARPSLREVCAHPLVCMPPGTGLRGVLDQACATQGIRPAIAVQASAGAAITQLAQRGLGVGILSESMADAEQAGPTAVVIGDIQTPAVLAVIWALATSPALRELITRCRAAFRLPQAAAGEEPPGEPVPHG